MTPREALIHAAFKGLAEGLMVAAEPAAPVTPQRRAVKARRRAPRTTAERTNQLPLSPQMADNLKQQFEAIDPRPPDTEPTLTIEQLDAMMRGGSEAVDQLARQMRMQQAAAEGTPPKKPPEPTVAPAWGIPDE